MVKVISPAVEILTPLDGEAILKHLELCARNCYKSEVVCNVGEVDAATLIVDDLSDSGNTIRLLRRSFPDACYVTVYAKPAGQADVDIFARELPDRWLVFPWD